MQRSRRSGTDRPRYRGVLLGSLVVALTFSSLLGIASAKKLIPSKRVVPVTIHQGEVTCSKIHHSWRPVILLPKHRNKYVLLAVMEQRFPSQSKYFEKENKHWSKVCRYMAHPAGSHRIGSKRHSSAQSRNGYLVVAQSKPYLAMCVRIKGSWKFGIGLAPNVGQVATKRRGTVNTPYRKYHFYLWKKYLKDVKYAEHHAGKWGRSHLARAKTTKYAVRFAHAPLRLAKETCGPLRFSFNGAVALAKATFKRKASVMLASSSAIRKAHLFLQSHVTSIPPASNLVNVSSLGTLSNAVTSGQAQVTNYLIGPQNYVYASFTVPVSLTPPDVPPSYLIPSPGDGYCVLAKIDPSTGTPTCMAGDNVEVQWGQIDKPGSLPIQFDGSGGIYYAGWKVSSWGPQPQTSGPLHIFRYKNGVTTDLTPDPHESFYNWAVLPDGAVLVQTSIGFLEITPSDSLEYFPLSKVPGYTAPANVATVRSSFMDPFSDGNIYMAGLTVSSCGLTRIFSSTDSIDPSFCQSLANTNAPQFLFQTTDGRELGWFSPNTVQQYYPAPTSSYTFSSSPIVSVLGTWVAGSNVIELGSTQPYNLGDVVLMQFDPAAQTSKELLGPSTGSSLQLGTSSGLTIDSLAYDPKNNTILFSALQWSTNSYVVGTIDVGTGAVTLGSATSSSGTAELSDIQAFDCGLGGGFC